VRNDIEYYHCLLIFLSLKPQYFIAWDGIATPTWELAELVNQESLIYLFDAYHPDKPGPIMAGSAHVQPCASRGSYCYCHGRVFELTDYELLASWIAG
jgi:hypothetical protein